jgi:hypothetical protein
VLEVKKELIVIHRAFVPVVRWASLEALDHRPRIDV